MKKIILVFLVIVLGVVFTSCLKPKHSVRVENDYPVGLRVKIGPNDYGTVGSGSTTGYKDTPEGSHTISGDVTGTMSISGKGKHKWTVAISSGGAITFAEDK